MTTRTDDQAAARARTSRVAQHAAVCDRFVPWAHGTAVFAGVAPSYWDFNVVRCEAQGDDAAALDAEALVAAAERLQAGLAHRRVEVWDPALGARAHPGFTALGWDTERHTWMHRHGPPPDPAPAGVEVVPVGAARALRAEWMRTAFPADDLERFLDQQDVAGARRGGELRTLAVREDGELVAFARVRLEAAAGELEELYVARSHRGRGHGRTLALHALAALGDGREQWVLADEDDWPKRLYARLGYEVVWLQHQFTRLPR